MLEPFALGMFAIAVAGAAYLLFKRANERLSDQLDKHAAFIVRETLNQSRDGDDAQTRRGCQRGPMRRFATLRSSRRPVIFDTLRIEADQGFRRSSLFPLLAGLTRRDGKSFARPSMTW